MKSIEEMTLEAIENNTEPEQSDIDSAMVSLIDQINNEKPGFKDDASEAGCDTYESYARYCMELEDEYNALLFESAAKLWWWVEGGCSTSFAQFSLHWTSSF